ncbi:MAG TPA: hypothetical protein VGI10_28770 [Polyangiaceae bacterium]
MLVAIALPGCFYSVADPARKHDASVSSETCGANPRGALSLDSSMYGSAEAPLLARSSAGSLLVSGQRELNTVLSFDLNHSAPPEATSALFLASFAADQSYQWLSSLRATLALDVRSLVATRDGGAVLCGDFQGTLSVESVSLDSVPTVANHPAELDAYLARFDANGRLSFLHAFGNDGYQSGRSVVVDADDNVILATFSEGGALDFDSCLESADPGSGLYLTKFDPNGHCLWSQQFPMGVADPPITLAYSERDATLLLGGMAQAQDVFGGHQGDGNVAFVARLQNGASGPSILGSPLAFPSNDGLGQRAVYSIATNPCDDDLVVAGAFNGNIAIGGMTYSYPFGTAPDTRGLFLSKLTPSVSAVVGEPRWTKVVVDDGAQDVRRVASNGRGDVVMVGVITPGSGSSGVDFGSGLLTGSLDPTDTDMFLVQYADNGDDASPLLALRPHDSAGNKQEGSDALLAADGSVVVSSSFFAAIDLGGGNGNELTSDGWSALLSHFKR